MSLYGTVVKDGPEKGRCFRNLTPSMRQYLRAIAEGRVTTVPTSGKDWLTWHNLAGMVTVVDGRPVLAPAGLKQIASQAPIRPVAPKPKHGARAGLSDLLEYLATHPPQTVRELADALGSSPQKVRNALKAFRAAGQVVETGRAPDPRPNGSTLWGVP